MSEGHAPVLTPTAHCRNGRRADTQPGADSKFDGCCLSFVVVAVSFLPDRPVGKLSLSLALLFLSLTHPDKPGSHTQARRPAWAPDPGSNCPYK